MHPLLPRLLKPNVAAPTLSAFLFEGNRRVPTAPLPSMNPTASWAEEAAHRAARDMARAFHGAARDRRRPRADGSGLGPARLAVAVGGPEALPAGADRRAVAAAAGCRGHLARPLRSPRLPDDSRARRARRAVRHVARRRRAPRGLGRAGRADLRTRLVGVVRAAEGRPDGDGGAFAAFLRPRPARPQLDAVVVDGAALAAALGVLQRRHGPHAPSTPKSASGSVPSTS